MHNKINPHDSSLAFLGGGGAVGALMRSHNWSLSKLGHPSTWEQSLRTVVGLLLNSKFPMFIAWGPELGFLYNDSYAEILGSKHPHALGGRFKDIWAEIWDDIHPSIEQALAGDAVFHENLPLTMNRHGYDEQTWFTFSYSPVRNEHGNVAGMYCAVVETTRQVLAETYRNEENERFRALFENAPSFMAILSGRDYVFELANNAYYKHVGHRNIIGKPLRDALPELVEQGYIEIMDGVYLTGRAHVGNAVSVKFQREANSPIEERFVDFVYQPMQDREGNTTGIFVEGNDVTNRMHAEQDLRKVADNLAQTNRRQSEFLATLAHELRNPLAPIRTGLDLMRTKKDNPPALAKIHNMMERQTDHLVHLVDDLLDLARITTGKIVIKKVRVQLETVLQKAVETTLPLIQAKNHHFNVLKPEDPIWLDTDENRLAQVIANILSNAAKYTPDNGKIDLTAWQEADEVVVVVQDNGIGIPADAMSDIFEMFTQASPSVSQSMGGLGIGLSIVKRITEKLGGTVSAFSAGLDQGSKFMVRLPASQGENLGLVDVLASPKSDIARSRALRVLVVDDNRDAAELIKQLLESEGHTVKTANDGKTGLGLAQQFQPDLALLDIGMPGMDGFQLAQALRQIPPLKSIHLVALTGWGSQEDRERTRCAGFDEHLTKPIDFRTLVNLISSIRPHQSI